MRAEQNAAKNLTNFELVFSVQLFEPFGFATTKYLETGHGSILVISG